MFLFLLKSVESGPVAVACCLVTLDLILCSRSAAGGALVLGCSCQGPIWASGDLCCCCQPHFVTSPPHQPSNCGKGSSRNIIRSRGRLIILNIKNISSPVECHHGTIHQCCYLHQAPPRQGKSNFVRSFRETILQGWILLISHRTSSFQEQWCECELQPRSVRKVSPRMTYSLHGENVPLDLPET